jgi:2,3-bisphosphoglycerate-independent phosphoglycerate mutase
LGIKLGPDEVAFRCNLITAEGDRIADYASGHITSEEAKELVASLSRQLSTAKVKFYPGISYRHICVVKDAHIVRAECTPPHDVIGQPVKDHLPRGDGAAFLIDLMERSRELLQGHEVNKSRVRRGQRPANMIWLWGQGVMPRMPSFRDRFGVDGGVISAVDLLNGIAKLVGLDLIEVPEATGYYDTNYEGKGAYAVKSLEHKHFVLVHVEAPDEAGHNGDLDQKIRAIESFDRFVVGPMMRRLGDYPHSRLMVLPDHPTPIRVRTHTGDPVPFAWCGQGIAASGAGAFSEREAAGSRLQVQEGYTLMGRFIHGEKLVE